MRLWVASTNHPSSTITHRRPYGPTAPQPIFSTTVNTTSNYTEQLWASLFPLSVVAEIVMQNIEKQYNT